MHSGLQAGFQQKSLLYTVEPKGLDCELESINEVDVGHLNMHQHRHTITHTQKQANSACIFRTLSEAHE